MKKFYLIFLLLFFSGCFENKTRKAHNVKIIVFDFDGTIANTLPLAIKCINQLASEYGYKPFENEEAIPKFRNKSMKEIISKDLGLKFYQLPNYAIKAKKIFNQNLNEVTIFNGLKEVAQSLAKKYELAIISSNSQEAIKQTLEKAGIAPSIKYLHSDSSIFGKHAVIKRFLKAHHLEPDEIIYIGDEIRDIDACKKIGVKIISVTWGYNSKNALENAKPDYLIDSCTQIQNIMESISA
jgi:phosphoglycolate phosphatase